MNLSSDRIQHLPDFGKCINTGPEIKAEADCSCGVKERHTHCAGCGKIASIGDWDAKPIAEYTMNITRGTFKRRR